MGKIALAILSILLIVLGFLLSQLWINLNQDKLFDGLRFVGNYTRPEAIKFAETYDPYGDWVCSNIKGMDYEQCVVTANHECAHELFAEIIEKDPDKINKVMAVISDKT